MNNLFFLLIVLMWSTNANVNKHEMQDYIQIQFTGVEQHSSKQLFIVKRGVDFETIVNRLDELGLHATPPLTKENKELIWERMFNTIITDDKTFSKISRFVIENQKFYDDKEQSQFSIVVNGTRHPIILKLQKEFFNQLAKYLTDESCDKNIIKQINSY